MFKIRLWKQKRHGSLGDWQLRITKGKALIERDAGRLSTLLDKCHLYDNKNPTKIPKITVNLYGCKDVGKEDGKSPRLSKKERKMVRWPKKEKGKLCHV